MAKTLTIVASNRDRFDLSSNQTKWFLKSIESQTNKDFEVVIADGGSKNVEEIKEYFAKKEDISMRVVDHQIGEQFERARLNNVGIRNAKTEYVMTTDVDMFFAPKFVGTLMSKLSPQVFVESRTMYWKGAFVNKIYSKNLDPIKDIDSCKFGRIKKRTSAGGCQCAHIDIWNKVRGFDEKFIGWGSEDVDLLGRMQGIGLRTIWMGEAEGSIMLFHQPHHKDVVQDIKEQNKNKRILALSTKREINPNGWGGIE